MEEAQETERLRILDAELMQSIPDNIPDDEGLEMLPEDYEDTSDYG